MFKKILIGLAIVLVGIQFFRPGKNISNDNTNAVSTKYVVPDDVHSILKVACNDCHSNQTDYPWYVNIQPVAWWMNDHIQHGKRYLNLSEFTDLPIAVQYHNFGEIAEMVEEEEMPLPSYTYLGLYKDANLTGEQRSTLINWAKAHRDTLKATYPADSLKMKRPPGRENH